MYLPDGYFVYVIHTDNKKKILNIIYILCVLYLHSRWLYTLSESDNYIQTPPFII